MCTFLTKSQCLISCSKYSKITALDNINLINNKELNNIILYLQNHYLVSGSNDSEITVWDINKPPAPISPGKRTTPLAPITSLAWNKQVYKILK